MSSGAKHITLGLNTRKDSVGIIHDSGFRRRNIMIESNKVEQNRVEEEDTVTLSFQKPKPEATPLRKSSVTTA